MRDYIECQFVLGNDWLSLLIAWYGQGYLGFSHVDGILSDGKLAGARSDSIPKGMPRGFQVRPADYLDGLVRRRLVLRRACSATQADDWENLQRSSISDGYDMPDIAGFILGKPRTAGKGFWDCSGRQLSIQQSVGIMPKNMIITPQQTTPNTLAAMMSACGAIDVTQEISRAH